MKEVKHVATTEKNSPDAVMNAPKSLTTISELHNKANVSIDDD